MEHVNVSDEAELAFLVARDAVSDEALAARVLAAPDMGGALLVELSEFLGRRHERANPAKEG